MKFAKEWLLDDGGKTIIEEIVDQRRWVTVYRRVFEDNGRFFETHFERGSTEQQDISAYEHEDDEIECREVFRKEKTVIVYE